MENLAKRRLVLLLLGLGCCISLGLAGYLALLSFQTASQVAPVAAAASPHPASATASPTDVPVTIVEPTLSLTSPTPSLPAGQIPALNPEQTVVSTRSVESGCVITQTSGLVTEFQAIIERMPGTGSNGMVVPSTAQMAVWKLILQAVLQGDTRTACALIRDNGFPYHILDFTDIPNDRARYWILEEDQPSRVGWGTYVIRAKGFSSEVVVEVPHPIADDRTELEGVVIFRQINARALLLAGTNRCANQGYSSCSGTTMACGKLEPYRSSDVAHADQTMFQTAHEALVSCAGGRVALQLHGNDLATCPDVFVSNGTLFPHQLSAQIYQRALESCSPFTVDLAEGKQTECAFYNGSSVQAVYTNGCAANPDINACSDYVGQPSNPEQFISIEQSSQLRLDYGCFVDALKEVWPAP